MNNAMNQKLYNEFSRQSDLLDGNNPKTWLYRKSGYPKLSNLNSTFKKHKRSKAITGICRVVDHPGLKRHKNRGGKDIVDIAFTAMGDKGPLCLFLHGVPSNRHSYNQIMNKVKGHLRCVAIDMLGMGESQVDRRALKKRYDPEGNNPDWPYKVWLWKYDACYMNNVMNSLYPGEKFILFADDWGGGSAVHFASIYPDRLRRLILLDPVALDGYPVRDIMAIGRASPADDKTFQSMMGAFDQTSVQIYDTMVHNPGKVKNQYTKWIHVPYSGTDYVHGSSSTETIKFKNLRNLVDRSYVLGGPQLLPYHKESKVSGSNIGFKNGNYYGVKYDKFKANVFIMWGANDNMMPEQQRHRLRIIIRLATKGRVSVNTIQVPEAGHFAGWDQPDFVSANLLDYLMSDIDLKEFGDFFLGFNETLIWKGDEEELLEGLNSLDL